MTDRQRSARYNQETAAIDCDPVMFYAGMNVMCSDYCKAAEKANCSSANLFVCMAKAFLEGKDAKPHKLAR